MVVFVCLFVFCLFHFVLFVFVCGCFCMHHPTDRIAHTTSFVTPVLEHWLEREMTQRVHHEGSIRRPIASWADAPPSHTPPPPTQSQRLNVITFILNVPGLPVAKNVYNTTGFQTLRTPRNLYPTVETDLRISGRVGNSWLKPNI